jgi:hypothetical protein
VDEADLIPRYVLAMVFAHAFKDAWEVLMLFLIPIGGGIPAGVLLARARGLDWPIMCLLYFISDVILACLFEPAMKGLIALGRYVPGMARFNAVMKEAVRKSTAHYGNRAGPLALIMIAFGVDPMTGRAAAHAAGHGFVTGWLIAIAGDMMYFALVMASTLWLQSVLGDGTWTMIIILVLMTVAPMIVRRVRERFQS